MKTKRLKSKKRAVMSLEDAIELLERLESEDDAVLDIEGLTVCIEAQQEVVNTLCVALGLEDIDMKVAQAKIESLMEGAKQLEVLTIANQTLTTEAEARLVVLASMTQERDALQANLTAITAERDAGASVIALRREKAIGVLVGKHELVGHDATAIEAFKVRAEKLTFEELDAELTTLNKQIEESWGPSIRQSVPAEGDERMNRPLNLAQLQGFRV